MHARCPLYQKREEKFPNRKHIERFNNVVRKRLQYKIHREIFVSLVAMVECREEGKLDKLIKLAEHELGEHFRIYSAKLIPCINEFTVKICNYIALAHVDKLKLPLREHSTCNDDYKLLMKILNIPIINRNVAVTYVFGDQTTYRDPAEPDTSLNSYKDNINRLDRRLQQKPMLKIEICHLLYEKGREGLKQQRIDEARTNGRKIVETAQGVSHLWIFLGHLMICRADIMQRIFHKAKQSLAEAMNITKVYDCEELKVALNAAYEVNYLI